MRDSDEPAPSFMEIDTDNSMISHKMKIAPLDLEQIGTYDLDLKYTIGNLDLRQNFQVIVMDDLWSEDSEKKINAPPVFTTIDGLKVKTLPDFACRLEVVCVYKLPKIFD